MPAAIPVAAAVAGGVASAGASKLFGGGGGGGGGGAPTAPVLNKFVGNGVNYYKKGADSAVVTQSPYMQALLDRLNGATSNAQSGIQGLLARVQPGYSDFRNAALADVNNTFNTQRSQAIGDLRQNLARRGVLGSSFADSSINQANSAFADAQARAQADVTAQSMLQEIDKTATLISQDYGYAKNAIDTAMNQAQFETTTGVNLANQAGQTLQANAALQNSWNQASAAGAGAFWQPTIDAIGKGVSSTVSNWLTPTPTYSGSLSSQLAF